MGNLKIIFFVKLPTFVVNLFLPPAKFSDGVHFKKKGVIIYPFFEAKLVVFEIKMASLTSKIYKFQDGSCAYFACFYFTFKS